MTRMHRLINEQNPIATCLNKYINKYINTKSKQSTYTDDEEFERAEQEHEDKDKDKDKDNEEGRSLQKP